jgi:hypothetical protein
MSVWHFFVHWTGGDYGAGAYGRLEPYDWLSGIFGLSLLGIAVSNLRKYNCEVHRCWRMGRHTSAAGHHLCRKHHPDDPLTAEDAVAAHEEALSAPC